MKILLTILILMVAAIAHAGILWTWTNAGTGTEQGTFVTAGELVEGQAPPGSYTILDFSVTASAHDLAIGSISNGTYTMLMPPFGFDWDGDAPTVFWRDDGVWTNGFSLMVVQPSPGDPDRVVMSIDWFDINFDDDVIFLHEDLTPVITPESTITPIASVALSAIKGLFR